MWGGILPNGITPHDVALYIDGRDGSVADRITGTAYTDDDVTLQTDDKNAIRMDFNATTSSIDCGSEIIGAGDITFCCHFDVDGAGESNLGRVADNGKFKVFRINTDPHFQVQSDAATGVDSANDSADVGNTGFLSITRTSTGVVNIYIDGVLSGSADQDSGTPAAGDQNLFIGNNASAGSRTWDGQIWGIQVYRKILTLGQIQQLYNKFG